MPRCLQSTPYFTSPFITSVQIPTCRMDGYRSSICYFKSRQLTDDFGGLHRATTEGKIVCRRALRAFSAIALIPLAPRLPLKPVRWLERTLPVGCCYCF